MNKAKVPFYKSYNEKSKNDTSKAISSSLINIAVSKPNINYKYLNQKLNNICHSPDNNTKSKEVEDKLSIIILTARMEAE